MNIKISLLEESGKEIDLSDLWYRLSIQKSISMFVPSLKIQTKLETPYFLSTNIQNLNKINLQIQTKEQFTSSPFELLNWNNWEIATINANSSLERAESSDRKSTNFIEVEFYASITNSDFSRRVITLFLENQTVEFVLKKILSDMPIRYISKNSKVIPQIFLPNMRILNAVSYLAAYYDSPCFYIHDFDGIYFYELKDIVNNFKNLYEFIFTDSTEEISNPRKIKIKDSIGISKNPQLNAFTLSNRQNFYSYKNTSFFEKQVIELKDYFLPKLGSFKTKMFDKITNDSFVSTEANDEYLSNAYRLLSSNTITVFTPKIFLFSELRPGMLVYFNSTSSNFLSLKGNYVIVDISILFVKDQNINGGMYISLARFGNE